MMRIRTCTVVTQYVKNGRWSSISSSCSFTAFLSATERFIERLKEITEVILKYYSITALGGKRKIYGKRT
jgi:hypothetical protein